MRAAGSNSGILAAQSYNQMHWSANPNEQGYKKHGFIGNKPGDASRSTWSGRRPYAMCRRAISVSWSASSVGVSRLSRRTTSDRISPSLVASSSAGLVLNSSFRISGLRSNDIP